MSYEDKVVVSRSPSPKTPILESTGVSRSVTTNTSSESAQASTQQPGALHGPVAILWDIENCPVPSDVRPEDVAGNIRLALRVHPVINGAVTLFSAYGDFNSFPRRLREGCQRTGVKLVDVPNGRKDAADKAILVDMFLFALDNRPPSSILLISGDVDYAPALHILGQRGYTIILAIPSGVGVSSALTNAGRFVWDWSSVSRGEGFVPPGTYLPRGHLPRGHDFARYSVSCIVGNNPDVLNEEEAIVYRGISQSNEMHCYGNMTPGPTISPSRSQSLPLGSSEAPSCRTRPGDIQGLKGQLVRLLDGFGGSLSLVRVPPEYLRCFGRPLYMSEYGVCKLVNLIQKMDDTMVVIGSGTKKQLCLRSAKKCPSTDPAATTKDTRGKEDSTDVGISRNQSSSSEDFSDGENERLDGLKQEVQELLVCYSCPVPLTKFESLYKQRYKKDLDLRSFGAEGLEELMEKVSDVVALHEDQRSKMKFLVSSCFGR